MLAYVYWHVAPRNIAAAQYESALLRFAQALAAAKWPGFPGNANYAVGTTPWLGERTGPERARWLDGTRDRPSQARLACSQPRRHNPLENRS